MEAEDHQVTTIQEDIVIGIIRNIHPEIQEVIEGAIALEDIIHLETIDITIQKGIIVHLVVDMAKEIIG